MTLIMTTMHPALVVFVAVAMAGTAAVRGAAADGNEWFKQLDPGVAGKLGESGRTRMAGVASAYVRQKKAIQEDLDDCFWQTAGILPHELESLRGSIKTPDPAGLGLVHGAENRAGRLLSDRERARLLAATAKAERLQRDLVTASAESMAVAVAGLTLREKESVRRAWKNFISSGGEAFAATEYGKRLAGRVMSVDPKAGRVAIQPSSGRAAPTRVMVTAGTKLRVLGRRGQLVEVKPSMIATALYVPETGQALALDVKAALRRPPNAKMDAPAPTKASPPRR
jgi:hypothetical protein